MSFRTRVLLLAPFLAAGIIVVGAGPASAATTSPTANCVGFSASNVNQLHQEYVGVNGAGGQYVAVFATNGGLGSHASSDCQ